MAWQDPQAAAAYVKAMPRGRTRPGGGGFCDTWAQAEPRWRGSGADVAGGRRAGVSVEIVVDHWVNDGEAETRRSGWRACRRGVAGHGGGGVCQLVSPTYPMLAGPLVEGLGDEDARPLSSEECKANRSYSVAFLSLTHDLACNIVARNAGFRGAETESCGRGEVARTQLTG